MMKLALDLNTIQQDAFGRSLPKNLADLINKSNIFVYIFGAAGIALLIYMVTGGLQMMTSRGDPKAMQGAQAKITNALLGFVIIIIAFAVVTLIGQLFGLGSFADIFSGSGLPPGAK